MRGPQLRNKIVMSLLIVATWTTLGARACLGLDKSDDIDTNRPSFMNSPIVVPRSSIQVENGTLFQGFQRGWQYDVPETEVRVGLTSNTEFQMFVPNYTLLHGTTANTEQFPQSNSLAGAATTRSAVSDLTEIGIKHQLGPLLRVSKNLRPTLRASNLAVILGVTPPTGNALISGTGTAGALRIPYSIPIGKNYCVGGMQSILLLNSGRTMQYQPDVLFGRNIGKRAFIFAEYGGFFSSGQFPLNIAHFGGIKKLNRNSQIDMQFGFGMNRNAPIALIGVGYSFRFDKLSW